MKIKEIIKKIKIFWLSWKIKLGFIDISLVHKSGERCVLDGKYMVIKNGKIVDIDIDIGCWETYPPTKEKDSFFILQKRIFHNYNAKF